MSTTIAELAKLERPFVVDVRSCSEFSAGHIPGAVSIPMDEAEARLGDIPSDIPVYLVCHSGDRSKIVCDLIRRERPNADTIEGGTEAWISEGHPTVQSSRVRWSIDRQVRLIAGLIVLIGTVLSVVLSPGWVYVAMFIGAGLTFAGLANFCGMAALLAQMPWNKPAPTQTKMAEVSK